MLFYTYDLAEYRDTLRGFYFDFEQNAPGPLVETNDALMAEIEIMLENPPQIAESFLEQFCTWEDGHAAEKNSEKVFAEK